MVGSIIAKQVIRSSFDALNKGHLEKFLKGWSKDGIFIYPGKVKQEADLLGNQK